MKLETSRGEELQKSMINVLHKCAPEREGRIILDMHVQKFIQN